MEEHFDVLIVGAGLSGIGVACHLAMECPSKRYTILERRDAIGGTWDLFRYPGIRSDSDMLSFGYRFRPWHELKVLADGPAIKRYVTETAQEHGVEKHIRYGLKVTHASWSSACACWTLRAQHEASGQEHTFRCDFLVSATGYYDYDQGYLPDFPGAASFRGEYLHPQHWPEALDYTGKRVVVIGSGATAVTLVPAMAEQAAHVTMLQRSPGYIFSVPGVDQLSGLLSRFLPPRWVYAMARRRNISLQRLIYRAARRYPRQVRALLLSGVRRRLGQDVDMRHFTPAYNPWDERLCAVPDADLFKAIRSGKASVVTDQIDTFTARGIRLRSGDELEADIIVAATGLRLQVFGAVELSIDGAPRSVSQLMTYKGVLVQGVPNMAWIIGYTNASWTLKADLAAQYICRLLNHMEATDAAVCVAHAPEGEMLEETILGSLNAGYVRRAQGTLPRQGRALPWRMLHDYRQDRRMLLHGPIEDGVLELVARGAPAPTARKAA